MINRIILIGNGFDLAHGMKTSYRNFINDYWEKRLIDYYENRNSRYICEEFSIGKFIWNNPPLNFEQFLSYIGKQNGNNFQLHNSLFFDLSQLNASSWVDIETFYYSELKQCTKSNGTNHAFDISKLNGEFEKVKDLLEKYLTNVENNFLLNDSIYQHINSLLLEPIYLKDLSEESIIKMIDYDWESFQPYINNRILPIKLNRIKRNFLLEYLRNNKSPYDKDNFIVFFLSNFEKLYASETPLTEFVNFNYTKTEKYYIKDNFTCHIHGELKSTINPIIFGYGDELDDYYLNIEKLNDNRYLENVKSINYAKTDNYKKVINALNNGLYQVFIIGHSCGNSDRTLLNTIFEHDNCASIKIFYHEKENNQDNYLDIYKNISRNFNNKAKLRDRVVNKQYSNPLVPYEITKQVFHN